MFVRMCPECFWKVLVMDRFCLEVVSPILKVGDLRSMGVTLNLWVLIVPRTCSFLRSLCTLMGMFCLVVVVVALVCWWWT